MQNINYIYTSIYVKHDFVFIIYSGIENCSQWQKLANEVQIPFRYAFILRLFSEILYMYEVCWIFPVSWSCFWSCFLSGFHWIRPSACFPSGMLNGRRSWHPRPQDAMVFINDIFQLINGYAFSYILCLMCFYLILLY